MLIEKNKSYGDSVCEPVKVFSKLDPEERIGVRLDDKLARLKCGGSYGNEDTELDIIGYLILKRVMARKEEYDFRKEYVPTEEEINKDRSGLSEYNAPQGRKDPKLPSGSCGCADCACERKRLRSAQESVEGTVVSGAKGETFATLGASLLRRG